MKFSGCGLAGAMLVEVTPAVDERGWFARTYCPREFAAQGITVPFRQSSVSFNARRGTLRGMHFQAAPHAEAKLVRCTAGAVYDVIVDIRGDSPTCGAWFGTELSASNRRALYIPAGFAHGFVSLADATELLYMISADHVPEAARGFRWNDPAIGITWPIEPLVISARDAAFAAFSPAMLA